jgi:hypothetical protein
MDVKIKEEKESQDKTKVKGGLVKIKSINNKKLNKKWLNKLSKMNSLRNKGRPSAKEGEEGAVKVNNDRSYFKLLAIDNL